MTFISLGLLVFGLVCVLILSERRAAKWEQEAEYFREQFKKQIHDSSESRMRTFSNGVAMGLSVNSAKRKEEEVPSRPTFDLEAPRIRS